MPMHDWICTNDSCEVVTEKIVRSYDATEITCPACGGIAIKADLGQIPGAARHVGIYFNYLAD
jgi:hypothetical protein